MLKEEFLWVVYNSINNTHTRLYFSYWFILKVSLSLPISRFISGNKANIQSHYRGHKLSMWLNLIPQLHRHFNINDQSMRHHQFQDDLNNRDLYEGNS